MSFDLNAQVVGFSPNNRVVVTAQGNSAHRLEHRQAASRFDELQAAMSGSHSGCGLQP